MKKPTLPNVKDLCNFDVCSMDVLRGELADHLYAHILPFWNDHAMDAAGGINTCIADDGKVLSRHKFLWGQWRAVWVYARLFNRHGGDPAQLETALQIAEFAIKYGWDGDAAGWRLIVDAEGKEVEGCTSLYTDGFAMYALGELFKATGDSLWRDWAIRTAEAVLKKIEWAHDRIPHSPYPVPKGARVHGLPMVFSLKFAELGRDMEEARYVEKARELSDEVFKTFHQADLGLIFERVAANGSRYPGASGSVVNPGHVIEDMWFQIDIAPLIGREERIPLACDLILKHIEFGWDEAHGGGLLLARDAYGGDEIGWGFPDMKLWWPLTEALYATLLGYSHSGDERFLSWYNRIWQHCVDHYYNPQHGEWRQKLNRDLTPFSGQVVYPVKDPFHLPRSLILQIELLEPMRESA